MGEDAWNEQMARMKQTYIYNSVRFDVTLLEDEVVADFVGALVEQADAFDRYINSVEDKGILATIAKVLRSIRDFIFNAEYEAARASRVLGDIDRYFDEDIKPTSNVRFSLATDVVSILEEYDNEGVKYGSILDVAEAIEGFIAESTEDTTELENILDDFRAAQDEARRWGNRMDSGGEEDFEDALRAYVNKATLGERSDADSHNSSSEGLLSEGSERLSVNPLTPSKDGAKIANDTEITKRAATKIVNEGGIKSKVNTPAQAVSALGKGLHLDKSDSSQSYYGDFFEGDYIVNGKVVHLRISTHPATPARMGNAEADHKVSVVIRKNGEHKSDGTPHSGYTEYVYEPSEVTPQDAANAVVKGVKSLLETGEFIDETGKAVRKDYPYTDNRGRTMYSLITPEMDAFYLDAVERGDIILLNGGMLITSGDAHRSTMHEYAHSITKKYLGERLAEVTASILEAEIDKARKEMLPQAYNEYSYAEIIDEFTSLLLEDLTVAETRAILRVKWLLTLLLRR